jgi:3-hydroxybutyryl-CoA dehydratase
MNPGLNWYEDCAVGDSFTTGGIVVTESLIQGFAGISGDHFDLHVDDEFARGLGFTGRVAHGILGLALTDGLKNRAEYRFRAVASLGWNWKFTGAILVGDRIQAVVSVQAKRETKRPDRGILTLAFEVKNQRGEVVQQGTNDLLVLRRPKS